MREGSSIKRSVWMKVLLVLLATNFSLLAPIQAQDEPEYKMEVGAGVGLMNYLGDYNGNLLKDMQPMGGLVAKYKMNPRMAWAATLNYGQLKGDVENADGTSIEQDKITVNENAEFTTNVGFELSSVGFPLN